MTAKSQPEIIAVVCPKCGYADQVVDSNGLDLTCPGCESTMIAETLSRPKPQKTRTLKVVKSKKETGKMTKRAESKGRHHRVIDEELAATDPVITTPDTPMVEFEGTFLDINLDEEPTVASLDGVELEEDDESGDIPGTELSFDTDLETSPAEESPTEEASPAEPTEPAAKPARTPFMTQSEIWTTYANVLLAGSPDDIFDIFGRTFDDKYHLARWNDRVGLRELYKYYRPRDTVEFFRKVAHEIWSLKKHGLLNPPKNAEAAMETWNFHQAVVRAESADAIFDLFGRTFEEKTNLSSWLHASGHGELVALGRGSDIVEYFRKVAHALWTEFHKKG